MTRAVFDVLREEARYQRITPEPVIRPQQRESPGRIPKYKWGTKDNLLGKHSRLFEDEKLMALISVDFDRISAELIRELTRHPGGLYSLTSRQFEELIAEILNRHGWETALTGRGPDNGVDIVAIRLDRFTRRKLIVQCKRYSPHNKVGLSIVKELFATSVDQDGSHALLATTSWFTAPARNFELRHEFRLQLQDFNGIVQWLNDFDG
jgi:restriction system protein